MKPLALTLSVLFGAAATLSVTCQLSNASERYQSDAYQVQLPIEKQAIRLEKLSGEFQASEYTKILSDQEGKITNVLVNDGAVVKKGTPLFEFNTTFARLAVQAAQEEYQRALDNILDLTKSGVTRGERLDGARQAIDATRKNLLVAQEALVDTTIVAPFSGKVGQILVSAGNFVTKGQELTELIAVSDVELHFSAPNDVLYPYLTTLSDPSAHTPPTVSVKNANGQFIDGTLSFVDSKTTEQDQTLSAYATFTNSDNQLLVGSKTELYLNAIERQATLFVPKQAVHTKETQSFVYVLDGDKKVLEVPVAPLMVKSEIEGYLAVTGLEANQFVVNDPYAYELVGRKIEPIVNLVEGLNQILSRG